MTGTERESAGGESVLVLTETEDGTGTGTYPEVLSARDAGDRNVLAVTYRDAPDAFIDDWKDHHGHVPTNIGVIGVGGTMRSAASRSATPWEPSRRNLVRAVADPTDLPTLRRTVSECLTDWPTQEHPTVVYFDSLTALLQHVELPVVERFIERFTERIQASGATGYFEVDAIEHDAATIDSLASLFERVERPDHETGTDASSVSPKPRLERRTSRSVDAVFEVLCASRRRLVLHYLTTEAERVALDELVERLGAWETDGADGEVSEDVFRRVYTSLYQVHVPKLVDHGIVEYDRQRNVVTLSDGIGDTKRFLALAAEYDLETGDDER